VQGGDGQWSISDGEQFYGVRHIGARLDLNAQAQSALASVQLAPHRARPQITLRSVFKGKAGHWEARPDLLASHADAPHFVVEAEHDGQVELRFGDDYHGRRPNSGETFFARYRVGNGTAGNIGADSIAHVVSTDTGILHLTNPLPAAGGVNPETGEDIKRDAPEAFKVQERAVTPADYAAVTERHAEVQRAAATFRWTGSWHTVFLTVDRLAGASIDAPYKNELRRHVERYRMAGYDLEVDAPRFVPLELGLFVCVKPDYFRAHVRAALLQVFSNGWLANGQRAVFHPDNFSFGQPVYLSDLYAAAQNVEGVASVTITTFQRQREPSTKALDDGFIALGRLEIAQLDNDPNFPERGIFTLQLGGGK
jgi:predicted phage baseplate assembly protein